MSKVNRVDEMYSQTQQIFATDIRPLSHMLGHAWNILYRTNDILVLLLH